MSSVGDRIQNTGQRITSVGAKITAVGAAFTGAGLAFGKQFANAGDDIGKMSKRLGVANEALQEYGFALEQSGSNLAEFETGTRRMQRVILDAENGMKSASEALGLIGLDSSQLVGRNTEQQFEMIASALSKVDDASRKAAIAQQLFGRAGTKLVPLFNEGPKGLAALRAEAQSLGLVLSDTDISLAEKLTDSFNRAGRAFGAIGLKIGASLAEPLSRILDRIASVSARIGDFLDKNRGLVVASVQAGAAIGAVGLAITAVGAGFIAVGATVAGFGATIGGLAVAFGGLIALPKLLASATVFAFGAIVSPIGLVTIAIAGVVTAIGKLSGSFDSIGRAFGVAFGGMGLSISRIKEAFDNAGIVGAIEQIKTEGMRRWELFTSGLEVAWLKTTNFLISVAENAGQSIVTGLTSGLSSIVEIFGSAIDATISGVGKRFTELFVVLNAINITNDGLIPDGALKQVESLGQAFNAIAAQGFGTSGADQIRRRIAEFQKAFDDETAGKQRERLAEVQRFEQRRLEIKAEPVKVEIEIEQARKRIESIGDRLAALGKLFAPEVVAQVSTIDQTPSEETATRSFSGRTLGTSIGNFAPVIETDADKQVKATDGVTKRVGDVVEKVGAVVGEIKKLRPANVAGLLGAGIAKIAGDASKIPSTDMGFQIPRPAFGGDASAMVTEAVDAAFRGFEVQTDGATEETAKQTVNELQKLNRKRNRWGR